VGAFSATLLFRWLVPNLPAYASQVVVPHTELATPSAHPEANSSHSGTI
jgi:hypothetical protein